MSQLNNPEALFRAKSRTFSLAAKLFSQRDRAAVARLYSFCRILDDLADASVEGETVALGRVIQELDPAVPATDPVVVDFVDLAAERGLSLKAAFLLAEALYADCGTRQIENESELLNFAFGVAGTVGVLMCPVLGVNNRQAFPFALDLGIALQLTNIARDIVEDAERGRYYLPRDWVSPAVIERAIKGDATAITMVDTAVERLLNLAEEFYESAFNGLWFIEARNRRAVYLASRMYREIGQSLLRLGSNAWRMRRVLSAFEKLQVCLSALWGHRRMQVKLWAKPIPPIHSTKLAEKLEGAGVPLATF
ncbi:MAG: All-trans-phytoene synthase [Opitutia bacterium UBA7350]|nr:MAG: All-trans-phytoene synthase [Opitutae bacterium UBA7350]